MNDNIRHKWIHSSSLFICALLNIYYSIHVYAQDNGYMTLENEKTVYTHAVVGNNGLSPSIGYFTILRNNGNLCAVRFTSFRRERDGKNITGKLPYDEKKDSEYAEYEWYFTKSATGRFTGSDVTSGSGEVYSKPYWGFGIWPRKRYFSCRGYGTLIDWGYPIGISLIERKGYMEDPDISIGEAALTSWKKIEDVNALESTLIWYRNKEEKVTFPVDPNYKPEYIWIPVEDLPPKTHSSKGSSVNTAVPGIMIHK